MILYDPPHPGEIIREDCLKPLNLTVKEAAEGLGITRKALSSILNGHAGISAQMALRLTQAFGSTPETWLAMQMQYDLWQAKQRAGKIKVRRFTARKAA